MSDRLKYTCYFAGPMEHFGKEEMISSREELFKGLSCPELGIYDPVRQESKKVGKPSGEQIDYIRGLKRGGHYEKFNEEMNKIWWGSVEVKSNTDIIQVLQNLRMKRFIEGNRETDYCYWGDAEAVIRSDFVVVYLPTNAKTVGTYYEVLLAALFRIPVYLIVPDAPKTDTNSTLLWSVLGLTKGEVFYSTQECINYIKEKYKLRVS